MSNQHQLRFQSLGINTFAGITPQTPNEIVYPEGVDITQELQQVNPDNGLVIIFPQGYNYIELEGDQGVGKTSFIECIKEAAGGISQEQTINEDLKDKKYGYRFYGTDGFLYSLRVTKTTITLERIETEEDGTPKKDFRGKEISVVMKEPKTLLKKLVGAVGISPLALKEMSGADQVKWLRELFRLGEEAQRFELDLNQKFQKVYRERTEANSRYDNLISILSANPYFKEFEQWEKYFSETNFDDIQVKAKSIQEKYEQYQKAASSIDYFKNTMHTLSQQEERVELEIKQLEEKLAAAKQLLIETKEGKVEIQKRLTAGEKYLSENASIKQEYADLSSKIKEATEFEKKKADFNYMLVLNKQLDEAESEKIRLNSQVDELRVLKQKFIQQFTPEIEGVEVCIADGIDNREGIFYNGRRISILSESQIWEFVVQIWKKFDAKIIYIDNITNLGSGAIARFNEFLEMGGYIFGTLNNPELKNLKISFRSKIPLTHARNVTT